ncbi:MAG TPA: ATP-binding protein [Chloroflexota bacterium]|nr:ATP-binding protein [Chloroflexota bacterium]
MDQAAGNTDAPDGQRSVRRARKRGIRPQPPGATRVVVVSGGVGLLPLAVLVGLILLRPTLPAEDLLWPIVVLTVLATAAAVAGSLAVSQPQRRSIAQLHRISRRLLIGDPPGPVPSDVVIELAPLATDLAELAVELDRLRADLDRVSRELKYSLEGRQHLVSSLAIENSRLRAEASVVHEFVETVNRPLDREQVCLQLLNALEDELSYREALIYLVDPDTGQLRPSAVSDRDRNYRHVGRYVRELPNFPSEPVSSRSLVGVVSQTGKSICVADGHLDGRFVGLRDDLRSYLAVPIEVKSRVIGVLQTGDTEPESYDTHDERRLATLARYAAVWIENVRLFEEAAKVEALREVDRLKSELLSTVSHELRTPLASIKGYATSLLREDVEWDDETHREFLQIIDEESDRLSGLIEDLLQMSEIEAGVLRINKQPVRIGRLAQRVVKKLRLQLRDRTISVTVAPDAPETMGDPRRLEQVLHNLVMNAIKYSPSGTQVGVRVEKQNDDIVVSVKDQGIGIASEHLEHVFERFYRVDGALIRETGGSGLGLAICRGLVDAHGGKIWVESQVGQGSTFSFRIPIVPVDQLNELEEMRLVEVGVDE